MTKSGKKFHSLIAKEKKENKYVLLCHNGRSLNSSDILVYHCWCIEFSKACNTMKITDIFMHQYLLLLTDC